MLNMVLMYWKIHKICKETLHLYKQIIEHYVISLKIHISHLPKLITTVQYMRVGGIQRVTISFAVSNLFRCSIQQAIVVIYFFARFYL